MDFEYETDAFFLEGKDIGGVNLILGDYKSIGRYINASVAPEQQYLYLVEKVRTLQAQDALCPFQSYSPRPGSSASSALVQ